MRIFYQGSKIMLALVMVWAYLLGSVSFESLHRLVGDHPVVAHTAEQEKDPCHITLFHDEQAGGCEHPTHVSEVDTCTLCDHPLPVLVALVPEVLGIPVLRTTLSEADILASSKEGVTFYLPGRAPPVA